MTEKKRDHMTLREASRQEEVVGWGRTEAPWAAPGVWSVSRALARGLHEVGIEHAFGLLGGGIAPFSAGLVASPIRFHHFRHESGAAFASIEAHFASGQPTAVVVTSGPGLSNVLNGVTAARVDGAKVLLVSGFTSRAQVGRGAVQETSLASVPVDFTRPGSLFHDVCIPESVDELPLFLNRLRRGFTSPGGWVAHLGLSLALQTRILEGPLPTPARWIIDRPRACAEALDDCLDGLLDPHAVIWVGHGARGASRALLEFAEEARLPVVSSPRGKGVFPETHPLFVGVSGAGGSRAVGEWLARRTPRQILVIGTRLGEVTSFLAPGHEPSERWMHVDIDPTAFGAAFPGVPGRGILSDAEAFLVALRERAASRPGWLAHRRDRGEEVTSALALTRTATPPEVARPEVVRPSFLMQVLQRRIVDETDAVVMSEAGTSFTWCNAGLRFEVPDRYRTSAAWGSMGHFTTGCVGAAIVRSRRVVAVVGDGAMLMNNEINTAVRYRARVVWVVLNDAQFGLNQHGMTATGMRPVETQMPRTDFVAFARSQGADGIVVNDETELDDALALALKAPCPFVIDVQIDRTIPSPVIADRIKSLNWQAGDPSVNDRP
jgi:acetolactate synthase-1/2/3 large subunit